MGGEEERGKGEIEQGKEVAIEEGEKKRRSCRRRGEQSEEERRGKGRRKGVLKGERTSGWLSVGKE